MTTDKLNPSIFRQPPLLQLRFCGFFPQWTQSILHWAVFPRNSVLGGLENSRDPGLLKWYSVPNDGRQTLGRQQDLRHAMPVETGNDELSRSVGNVADMWHEVRGVAHDYGSINHQGPSSISAGGLNHLLPVQTFFVFASEFSHPRKFRCI